MHNKITLLNDYAITFPCKLKNLNAVFLKSDVCRHVYNHQTQKLRKLHIKKHKLENNILC